MVKTVLMTSDGKIFDTVEMDTAVAHESIYIESLKKKISITNMSKNALEQSGIAEWPNSEVTLVFQHWFMKYIMSERYDYFFTNAGDFKNRIDIVKEFQKILDAANILLTISFPPDINSISED